MYRDDLDAMIARVEALEGEATRLRARIDELDEENARLRELASRTTTTAPKVHHGPRQLLIRVFEGSNVRELVTDESVITIGGVGTHVQIDATKQVHALLASSAVGVVLANAGTATGTYVNGEQIKVKTLREGDEILVGAVRITISW